MTRFLVVAIFLLSQSCFAGSFEKEFVAAAIERTTKNVRYDGSYFSISYPNGDVPKNVGVCTDVVIRSYRTLGTDLQVLVHKDMSSYFDVYPSKKIWGLNKPDKNIDHRRVPNLQVFLSRHGEELSVSLKAENYLPGDIVTWMLPGNLPHIGIVTDKISQETGNPLIVHNIGAGPSLDDMLFSYNITGHYRYVPKKYIKLLRLTPASWGRTRRFTPPLRPVSTALQFEGSNNEYESGDIARFKHGRGDRFL